MCQILNALLYQIYTLHDTKQAYVQELLLDVLYLSQQASRSDYDLKHLVNDVLRGRYRYESDYRSWIEDLRRLAVRGSKVFVDALVTRVSDESSQDDNLTVLLLDAKDQAWDPELELDFFGFEQPKAQELTLQILVCVNRILAIMTLVAYRRQRGERLRIRYYRHRPARAIGSEVGEFLFPVNAAEVRTWIFRQNAAGAKSSNNHPLGHLALTITNRNSLAFYAKETDTKCGVLFSGECCIDPQQCWPTKPIVATVPHHGAKDNSAVYERVSAWALGKVVWVRSDWKCPHRPCSTYIHLTATKYCTICNTPISQKQAVELLDTGWGWKPIEKVKCCSCHCEQRNESGKKRLS